MKKIILGILLGLFIHKGLQTYCEWSWWSYEKQCSKVFTPNMTITERYQCIDNKMGSLYYIHIGTGHIGYSFSEWGWAY